MIPASVLSLSPMLAGQGQAGGVLWAGDRSTDKCFHYCCHGAHYYYCPSFSQCFSEISQVCVGAECCSANLSWKHKAIFYEESLPTSLPFFYCHINDLSFALCNNEVHCVKLQVLGTVVSMALLPTWRQQLGSDIDFKHPFDSCRVK